MTAQMKRIALLALEQCMQSSISGPYDILSLASRQWTEHFSDKAEPLFRLSIVTGDGQPVSCFNGITITPHLGTGECHDPDIIFIPVVIGGLETVVSNQALVSWIRRCNRRGTIVCAVCAGVFLAAQTGLLDGRRATTHWNLRDIPLNCSPACR